jgi:hypothetical protein
MLCSEVDRRDKMLIIWLILNPIPFEPAIIKKGIWGCNQRITSVAEEQNNEI